MGEDLSFEENLCLCNQAIKQLHIYIYLKITNY